MRAMVIAGVQAEMDNCRRSAELRKRYRYAHSSTVCREVADGRARRISGSHGSSKKPAAAFVRQDLDATDA